MTEVKLSAKPKTSVTKKAVEHPAYVVMITDCIKALKERGGTSKHAIVTYIMKTYKLGDQSKVNSRVRLALRSAVEKNILKQVKGKGANGSFRLGEAGLAKPKVVAASKRVGQSKAAASKTSATTKKPTVKKSSKKPTGKAVSKMTATKRGPTKKTVKKTPAAKTPQKRTAKTPSKSSAKKPAARKTQSKKPASKAKKAPAKK